jgi:DMSO/TMAO reductase YedYZ molybdopterin-dependent catalytic subunit
MGPDNLLCYEMNGAPLPPEHGFPLRLIAPGWYGITNAIRSLLRLPFAPEPTSDADSDARCERTQDVLELA